MKTKYEILISILDKLNKEAPLTNATYHKKDVDGKNHARSLSLIHLFLKSKFGLMDFSERVKYITDGGGDGGVDAYYIDSQNKSIYIIQSKFRSNKNNFEEKLIKYEEISSIEIERIRKGEVLDESDGRYNGKILGFQRKLDEIEDIVRYDYKVVLLANLGAYKSETIKRLLGGFAFDVYNFSRIYNEIVFPVCSGMYFDPRNITFEIETTEKGTEFSHSIETSYGEFSVRLIFVPALELARNVSKYRNSLLKFNPRNYLSLSNNGVNESIREGVLKNQVQHLLL